MLLETQTVAVQVAPKPTCELHLQVIPKVSVQTMQECEPSLVVDLFAVASRVASMLFDTKGAQGTNIVLQNNPVRVDVIGRKENDGLKLMWELKQGNMDEIQKNASDIASKVVTIDKPKAVVEEKPKVEVKKEDTAQTEAPKEEIDDKLWMRHRLP